MTTESTMAKLSEATTKIHKTTHVKETALAMINILMYVCKYCNSTKHETIFENSNWTNLVLATYNYIYIVTLNYKYSNNGEDNRECEYETENHDDIDTDTDTELIVAETAWWWYMHATFAPLKHLLNNTQWRQQETSPLRTRLNKMREAGRCILLALTHNNYQDQLSKLLSTEHKESILTTDMTTIERGESSIAIDILTDNIDMTEILDHRHQSHKDSVARAIQNFNRYSACTTLRQKNSRRTDGRREIN